MEVLYAVPKCKFYRPKVQILHFRTIKRAMFILMTNVGDCVGGDVTSLS